MSAYETLNKCLCGKITALCGTRFLAYLLDMSWSLRSGRLALYTARLFVHSLPYEKPYRLLAKLLLTSVVLSLIGTGFYFKDKLWLVAKYFEAGTESPVEVQKEKLPDFQSISLADRAKEAYTYAQENGFDLNHAVLIDFGRHSGKNRFFVWNFAENRVEIESLVAHGYGNTGYESSNKHIVFSNIPDSYTSSLGKYHLGIRSWSQWGINVHIKCTGLSQPMTRPTSVT